MENHFLNLRNSVDVHYQKQWGVGEHFISNKAFLRQLFIFNQEIEKKYYALLKNRVFLTEEEKEIFLTEVAELYNNQLKDILNTQNFALLPVDEPLVPLDNMVELPNINQCKVRDLALLSQLLSSHWQNFGNQQSRMICDAGSQAVDAIEQFSASKNKSEFAEKIINGFLTVQGINADELIKDFDRLGHFFCDSFLPEVKNIPIIGCFIPIESITKTLTEYFTSTKKAILEKKWSQIKRPPIDLLAITSWYNSFNTGFGIVKSTLALAGGPITFILNMILMPVIRKIISYTLQYGKSKTSALPIHLLAGLDELEQGLLPLLKSLVDPEQYSNQSVGKWLDKLHPVINNAALNAIIKHKKNQQDKLDENEFWSRVEQYINIFKTIESIIGTHREKKWHELFTAEILFDFYIRFLEMYGKQERFGFKNIEVEHLQSMFVSLKPCVNSMTVKQTFSLFKLLAHPQFYQFLKSIDGEVTFNQLQDWLKKDVHSLPEKVKQPFIQLVSYQTDSKRVEAETQQFYRTLETRFTLTVEKLQQYLIDLTPKPFDQKIKTLSQNEKDNVTVKQEDKQIAAIGNSIISMKLALFLLQCMTLIVINIIFFSLTLLVCSMICAGIIICQYFSQPQSELKETNKPLFRFFNKDQTQNKQLPELLAIAPNDLNPCN